MQFAIPNNALRAIIVILALLLTSGCATVVSNAASDFGENLSSAVLNQDDPETVKEAIPSFMILIDSLLEGNPDSVNLLSSAATLYASYGAVFAGEPTRAGRLTSRARRYATEAMCLRYADACNWRGMNYDEFVASLEGVGPKNAEYLYTYGFATLAYMRVHSSDWDTLAELPDVEALFEHYLKIAGDDVAPSTHTYMGILLTLRPPALGGKPEEAREHFEKAIAMTNGRDLSAKVEYARGYAKMLYDRELHDRLLNEVLEADSYADGLTLSNVLAKEEAEVMLAEADDYF